ncbi:ADP-ribosyl cyclase/cyclic ADP-ribose hydrolase 1-like [Arapaima gigas]
MSSETEPVARRRRCTCKVIVAVIVALVLLSILAAILAIGLGGPGNDLRRVVMSRCTTFLEREDPPNRRKICQTLWDAFTGAFVGRDQCEVPLEAYDQLVHSVPQKDHCHRTLFWSKTKHVVHQFTQGTKCLVTLEDTLLGFVMDGLTWCGRNGSRKTFTTGCPRWTQCPLNPVRSFWGRVSAAFAASACGNATVMLNGSLATPFDPNSTFGSIEVKNFNSSRMTGLAVVLVASESDSATCENSSLQNLQKALDPALKYSCKVVQQSQIQGCIADPPLACGKCW